MLLFVGGVLATGAVMLAGLFGVHGIADGDSNARAGWKERSALCVSAQSQRGDAVCELLAADATSTP
jgi:hypothetical protein